MLLAWELASMRAEVNASLPGTAAQMRASEADDGAGGSVETWPTIATLPCRVMPFLQRPKEAPAAGTVQTVMRHRIILPWNAIVLPGDRLVIAGETFKAMDTNDPSEAICLEAYCEKIT